MSFRFVAVLLAGTAISGHAMAALTTAELTESQQILNQFNGVIVGQNLGTSNNGAYNANNESEGPIAIGGAFNGGGHNIGFNGGAASPTVGSYTYGTVTAFGSLNGSFNSGGVTYVGGNITGSPTVSQQNNSNAYFAGTGNVSVSTNGNVYTTQASGVTAQNGHVTNNVPFSTAFPFASSSSQLSAAFQTQFASPLIDLSTALATLPSQQGATTQSFTLNGNGLTYTANADLTVGGSTYGLFTTTLATLASQQNFGGINNGSNAATIVIVTDTSGTATIPFMNANLNESRIIWDFVGDDNLSFNSFYGQILAPDSTVSNSGGVLTGSVVANTVNQSNEFHWTSSAPNGASNYGLPSGALTALSSDLVTSAVVPEPTTLGVFAVGLAGLAGGILRRRRKYPVA